MARPYPTHVQSLSAAATAAPSTGGVALTTARWGPDFGGTDGDQFSVGVSANLTNLALDSTDLLVGGSLTMPTVAADFAGAPGRVGVHAAMPALALNTTDLAVGVDTTSLTWKIPLYASEQEVWWDELAACVGTTNHPNEDLQIDGVAATRKDAIWKWNFFDFDANATVTAASLKVRVKTAPVLAATLNLHRIANAAENWVEADVDCNANPAAGANLQNFAIPAATGEITVVLNAAWLTRISTRFGAGPGNNGNCSMMGISNLANGPFTLEGADADADRPRLTNLTWTTPV